MRKWEKKIKDSEAKLDELNKELKEKEQENRISKLKIKEMKRMLKHNQLKPLNHDSESNGQAVLSNASQTVLPQLNKDNLRQLSKPLKDQMSEHSEENQQ